MDSLTYSYVPNSNRLSWARDSTGADSYGLDAADVADIDNQPPGNYSYDEIGNLIRDNAEGMT
ncbi:MAG TPA: hypothetical protein VK616_19500 [Flavitalea sp.]|nr:hypothetical protein [Flavitalea sp.]